MSCRRASCYCKCYKASPSKWSKNKCHSCNHPQTEHRSTQQSNNTNINRTRSTSSVSNHQTTKNNFVIGDKLQVLYENNWWKAEIVKITEEQIEITYDEWDEYSNESINKNSKRLRKNMGHVTKVTKQTNIASNWQKSKHKSTIINRTARSSSVAILKQKLMNNNKYKKAANIITNSLSSGDCLLCAGTDLSNIITLTKCKHKLCKDCMNNYIKITATDKLNIRCPFCSDIMDRYTDIKPALSHQEFYDIYLRPNLKKCLSANCNNTIKLIGSGVARLDCSKCEKSWCVNCNVLWHDNMNCDAYKKTGKYILSEQQFQSFLNENKNYIKKCPKCSVDIEKNNGCNHMHCVSCHIHFCWKCLFSAGDGNSIYRHMSTCF